LEVKSPRLQGCEFDGIKTVRCPKKRMAEDRHEHFRWLLKDEQEWRGA